MGLVLGDAATFFTGPYPHPRFDSEQAKKLQNRGVSEQNRKQKVRNLETNDRRFDWER